METELIISTTIVFIAFCIMIFVVSHLEAKSNALKKKNKQLKAELELSEFQNEIMKGIIADSGKETRL